MHWNWKLMGRYVTGERWWHGERHILEIPGILFLVLEILESHNLSRDAIYSLDQNAGRVISFANRNIAQVPSIVQVE